MPSSHSGSCAQVNTSAGMVWRRIKHFTGYFVAAGRVEGSDSTTVVSDATAALEVPMD